MKLAGGEGAHNVYMAKHLIDYGGVGFIQIDCGRIGGIGPSKEVADYAVAKGVTFVNHTFTSHLALSASMQPYAGLEDHRICEFPAMPKPLALEMTCKPSSSRTRMARSRLPTRRVWASRSRPPGCGNIFRTSTSGSTAARFSRRRRFDFIGAG